MQQARDDKFVLQGEILTLIKEYENKHGVMVDDVCIDKAGYVGKSNTESVNVRITVNIA
jgi:exosome complex RNA-binding protein Csl4